MPHKRLSLLKREEKYQHHIRYNAYINTFRTSAMVWDIMFQFIINW
jgi:hypothetical protein